MAMFFTFSVDSPSATKESLDELEAERSNRAGNYEYLDHCFSFRKCC
jgi:hypothetical protein